MEDNKKVEEQLLADMMMLDDDEDVEAHEEKEEVKILTIEEIQKIREQYQVSYPKLS